MLSPSLTHLLAEARVEELRGATRNHGRSRRLSPTPSEIDRSAAAALATLVTRTIARVVHGGGLSAGDQAAAIHSFEPAGPSSTARWSRQS